MKREKRVSTPDDFHPTFEDGTVSVAIHHVHFNKSWTVSVWGDDDFGMQKVGMDINVAFYTYRKIRDGITKEALRNRGFSNA